MYGMRLACSPHLGNFHRGDLAPLGEPAQRFRLELTDTLARDAENAADLLERLRFPVAVQRVAQLQDALLTLRQLGDGVVQRALGQLDLDLLLGRLLVAREEIAEGCGVAFTHGPVERCNGTRRGP